MKPLFFRLFSHSPILQGVAVIVAAFRQLKRTVQILELVDTGQKELLRLCCFPQEGMEGRVGPQSHASKHGPSQCLGPHLFDHGSEFFQLPLLLGQAQGGTPFFEECQVSVNPVPGDTSVVGSTMVASTHEAP